MPLIALHRFNTDRQMAAWRAGTEVIRQAAGGTGLVGVTLQPAWQFMGCSNAFRQPFCQIDNKPWPAEVGPEGLAMCERVGGVKSNIWGEGGGWTGREWGGCFWKHWMRPLHILTTTPAYIHITPQVDIWKMRRTAKNYLKVRTLTNSLFSINKCVFTAHTGYQGMRKGIFCQSTAEFTAQQH